MYNQFVCRIPTDWIMAVKGKELAKGIRDVFEERGLRRLGLFVVFYFLSRYVRSEGPWQRWAVQIITFRSPVRQ